MEVAAPLEGLQTSTAQVPDDADVDVQVTLESILDGAVTATGTVSAPWVGECRRCLKEVTGTLVADVREVFSPRPLQDEDVYPLDGDHVDLAPMARDAVLLHLPLAPLCTEVCAGPDPEGHPVSVEGESGEGGAADPRWSALGELRFD